MGGVGLIVRIGREEALDLLSKWSSERALLRCDLSFARFVACFRARVVAVNEPEILSEEDSEVKLLSDDTFSEMALRLTPDFVFAYDEPRGFPEEARVFAATLVIRVSSDDFISLTEIIER